MTDEPENPIRLSELLLAAGRRDRQAFELLYQLTSAKLFGICKRMLLQRSDAEDALQEAYLTIWRKAETFDAQRASAITWLAMIARNKCIDRLRLGGVERHTDPIELDELPEQQETTDPLELASEQRRLNNCLSNLEDKQQIVIKTAFFDGCTYNDLATRTGVPLGTMKSWIRRGLLSLKACLER
ncbi:MAG TPA: sigma-70 family RNA polymerase sigma factor [Pseudomonas xinjiangensis]|uniref:Sigma-70 family RNA polymerase sigma factor n=2 Tax=root TaxID=1 RepID=A0A7V1FSA3_9GAMM|nr:sigma-70 family RNA polymerase sigma factor [Halopseudomonas xinjiangensis]HEC48212.1 sigma-70 family RNA polymerase sigma factor [Halopseudomonas xinjiangensis]